MGIKIALEWACLQVNKKNHHGVITEMVLHLSIVLLTSTKSSRFFPHRENRMLILIQTNNNLSNKADKTSLSNYVSKDDLGIYFTADGSKAAVYKQNVISVSIQLKAGYTYFLVGKMVYPFQTMDRCQQRLMYCPMQVAFSILEILAQRCLMAAVV